MHDTTQVSKACQIPKLISTILPTITYSQKYILKNNLNIYIYVCFNKSLHADPLCTTMYIMILVEECT
jgi:hypothetical protein